MYIVEIARQAPLKCSLPVFIACQASNNNSLQAREMSDVHQRRRPQLQIF
jgi:hypothetical protein